MVSVTTQLIAMGTEEPIAGSIIFPFLWFQGVTFLVFDHLDQRLKIAFRPLTLHQYLLISVLVLSYFLKLLAKSRTSRKSTLHHSIISVPFIVPELSPQRLIHVGSVSFPLVPLCTTAILAV